MKYILLLLLALFELNAGVVKSPIVSLDSDGHTATIKIDKIDVGMSGFIVHEIAPEHTSILKNVVVASYDENTQVATLEMSDYTGLRNNALPTGNWSVKVGDTAVFAFGYSRALLVAPSEEIYHQISKSVKIQWIHPDIFATILSFRGHPTPLKEDFEAMSDASSVGLVFIYLDKKLFMLDIKSFKILTINDAPLVQDSVKLPFYTRVQEIDAAWWGEGSDFLESYEPHYYELLVESNKKNKKLYEIIKNGDEKHHDLLDDFEIGK
ncbi:MAG: plasminogen-binding N-terminal domain-containing protein [Campylobacterota bacterium]